MPQFGWTRLAYLTIVLAVLAALVKIGSLGVGALIDPQTPFALLDNETTAPETTLERTTADKTTPEGTTTSTVERVVSESDDSTRQDDGERVSERVGERTSEHARERAGKRESIQPRRDRSVPVFQRAAPRRDPTKAPSSAGARSSDGKVCRNVGAAPEGARILFPLEKKYYDSYDDTWGAARPQGGHEGTDLMVPAVTPEYAVTDGTIVPVSGSSSDGWNTLGGWTVMLQSDYSIGPVQEGDIFYYAHLERPTDLRVGDKVKAGDVMGFAGDTGQGPEGTSGLFPPHLHFGWYDVQNGRSQLASGAMNPYPLLGWIKSNGGAISGDSDAPYCVDERPSNPTPSNGGYWKFPSDPNLRPDLDTGSQEGSPTPSASPKPSAESSPNVTQEQLTKPRPTPSTKPNRPDKPEPGKPQRPDRPQTSRPNRPETTRPEITVPEITVPKLPHGLPRVHLPRLPEWFPDVFKPKPHARPGKPDDSNHPGQPKHPDKPDKPTRPETTAPEETTTPESTEPESTEPESTEPESTEPGDQSCEATDPTEDPETTAPEGTTLEEDADCPEDRETTNPPETTDAADTEDDPDETTSGETTSGETTSGETTGPGESTSSESSETSSLETSSPETTSGD